MKNKPGKSTISAWWIITFLIICATVIVFVGPTLVRAITTDHCPEGWVEPEESQDLAAGGDEGIFLRRIYNQGCSGRDCSAVVMVLVKTPPNSELLGITVIKDQLSGSPGQTVSTEAISVIWDEQGCMDVQP